MSESLVITGLRAKRAELAGELREAEKRLDRLRADLDAIDGAIRVFDPAARPETIRAKARSKPPAVFPHGQFSRLLLDVLRRSDRPLSPREIAEQIAREHGLDTSGGLHALLHKVRNTLARSRDGLTGERDGDVTRWRVA